jgi:hypothetical protein
MDITFGVHFVVRIFECLERDENTRERKSRTSLWDCERVEGGQGLH